MTKEALVDKSDLEPMATGLAATFFQRRDLYARQLEDGSTIYIRKMLEISHLIALSLQIWLVAKSSKIRA